MSPAPSVPVSSAAIAPTFAVRPWLIWAARFAVTLGLLGAVYWQLDAKQVFAKLAAVRLEWYVLGGLVAIGSQLLLAHNLRWALRLFGANAGFLQAVNAHALGSFANLFLPSSIGGDVVKTVALRKIAAGLVPAASAVLLARGLGVIGVITVAAFGTVFAAWDVPDAPLPRVVAGILALASLGLMVAWGLRHPLTRLGIRLCPARLKPKFVPVLEVVATLRLPTIATPAMIAVAYGFSASLWNSLFGVAQGLPVGFEVYTFAVPLVFLVTLLPISIHGIGVRDSAYVVVLAVFGVDQATALVFALLDFSGRILISLAGGLWVVFAIREQSHKS